MKMYTRAFNQIAEAERYVNENNIPKDKIVNLFESSDGLFLLVYYAN